MALLGATRALALECPGPEPIRGVDVEERLAYLAAEMDAEQARIRLWSFSWGSLYAAAGAVQIGFMGATRDRNARIDFAVGTGSAVFGAVSLFLLPLRIRMPLVHARERWGEPDRCRLLAEVEQVFARAARDEQFGTSWVGHVGTVVFNVGLTLLLGLAFHHWTVGLISGGVGLAVGEANLWTQPRNLPAAWERYRTGKLHARNAGAAVRFSATGSGFALTF